MTPLRAYAHGVRADKCVAVADREGWRVMFEGVAVFESASPFAAAGFIGRLRRLEAAGKPTHFIAV